jgi:hypothetical protein
MVTSSIKGKMIFPIYLDAKDTALALIFAIGNYYVKK